MSSFKSVAVRVLKRAGKPLHSKKITEIALGNGWLKSSGATPWATMNALLVTDVNARKDKSPFTKIGPSIFGLNAEFVTEKPAKKSASAPMDEEFVKHSIIKYISCKGWGSFQYGGLHEHGVDIRAKQQRYSRYLNIETKGTSGKGSANETGFVYGLGQIVTRIRDTGKTRNYYGIGLPESSARIARRRLPWQVAKKLLLFVYSVSADGAVEEYSWKELRNSQKEKKSIF
ncbi:winged helix-turn-helix domain-containing protein [Candidatus Uhrbacteria bacterium]|nr:winged helix-turn-helix domain-containing protein [Candidatus Uhrbacteria bacterium]